MTPSEYEIYVCMALVVIFFVIGVYFGYVCGKVANRDEYIAELNNDTKRLNWLQGEIIASYTGVTFDRLKNGRDIRYRFMRHHYTGKRFPTLRQCIDYEKSSQARSQP